MATATMVRKSQRRRKPTSIAASALVALGASDEDDMATAQAAGQGSAVPSDKDTANMMIQLGRSRGLNAKTKKKKAAPTQRKRKAPIANKSSSAARKRANYNSVQPSSTFLPLRTRGPQLQQAATPADFHCPVVKGRPVLGSSGGVQFQFGGFSGGLVYRGRCRPNRVSNAIEPRGEVSNIAQTTADCITTRTMVIAADVMLCSGNKTPPPPPRSQKMNTPRGLSHLAMSPSGYSPIGLDPMTPHANITRGGVLRTPTSMPAVKTPTRLTQSAKRFHDALVESSPLALLASAVDIQTRRVSGGVSIDVTPSPADANTTWASATPTIPIPTFNSKDNKHDPVVSPEEKADGPKASAVFKRYNIRPKEKSSDRQTPTSLMTDLLYEKPAEQRHPPALMMNSTSRHRPTDSSTSADLARGAAALAAVMTGKVNS